MKRTVNVLVLLALLGCAKAAPTTRVNHWLDVLRAGDARMRKKAVFVLGNLGASDVAVAPALQHALRDADPAVRREAILALMKCGPCAGEVVPTFAEMQQNDPDARVRQCAARAVRKLQH